MSRQPALAACAAVLLAACAAPEPARRPDVLLVCIDALRADRLGVYGAGGGVTPNLDRLARRAVVFDRALSVASWTKPAVASLLTGRYPLQHRVLHGSLRGADTLAPEVDTLAEILAAAGYRTAAFVQNDHLQQRTSRLLQGFATTVEEAGPAPQLTHRFLSWLEALPEDAPYFAYLHLFDPHWPYAPETPAPGVGFTPADARRAAEWGLYTDHWWLLRERVNRGRLALDDSELDTLRKLYDSEVFATDAVLGRVIRLLHADGRLDRTLLVVTSDHGEGFLEHGRLDHGYGPYEELLRVPLIVRFPGRRAGGTRVGAVVQTVDVVPTILDVLGLPPPAGLVAPSLLPIVADPARAPVRPGISHERLGGRQFDALRTASHAYIRNEPVAVDSPRPPEVPRDLVPGVRVQLEGILVGGEVIGAQVTRVGAEDRDAEVAGPIEFVDAGAGTLGLVGYRVVTGGRTHLKDTQGTFRLGDLQPLQWVRAQGTVEGGVLHATRVERIVDPALREIELEGIVGAVVPAGDGDVALELCGRRVRVDPDAVWKRFGAERRAVPAPPAAANGVVEELYDLRADPIERRSVAAEQPALLATLRSELAVWQERLLRDAVPEAPRVELDAATRQRLRLLGYLR